MQPDYKDFINDLIEAVEEKKARNTILINVEKITTITSYILITTVDSLVQSGAVVRNVVDLFSSSQYKDLIRNKNSTQNNEWVLLDAGDFVINVFLEEARVFYNLEKIYTRGSIIYDNRASVNINL